MVLINQSPPPVRGSFIGWTILERLPLTTDLIERVAARAANIVAIGVALVEDPATHAVRIRAVLSGTPAARAGIVAGQVIQKELKDPNDRVAIVDVTRQKPQ